MANKTLNFLPVILTTSPTDLLYGGGAPLNSIGVAGPAATPYILIKKVRVINITASAVTISLFKGAHTGTVNAVVWSATSVPANSALEVFCSLKLDSSVPDYLTGLTGTTTACYLEVDGEMGLT